MKKFIKLLCIPLLIAALLPTVEAQLGGGLGGRRAPGTGVNRALEAEVFSVLSVDTDARTIRLRAADGLTGDVHVGESVYDLTKLKAGDKVRVDFVQRDEKDTQLRAASIWPEK